MFEAISASIGVQVVEMHSAFRLGNKQPNNIRPLKVTLTNRKQRKDIIDNARDIGTKAPYPYREDIIVKDLTPRQRVETKQRRMNKKSASTQKKKVLNNQARRYMLIAALWIRGPPVTIMHIMNKL